MKNLLCVLLFAAGISPLSAQDISVMQEQSQHYAAYGNRDDHFWDSLRVAEGASPSGQNSNPREANVCNLNKRVFGWHPYWVGSVYNNYQWNLLSDLCYFDYTVSPNTGNNTNASFAWSTSAAVTAAINNGTNVHICATMFSSHSTFWASSTAQQTFITNIISLLQARNGKGVNIDFEGMGSADRIPFTAFMQNLSAQLHAAIPGSELSVALYAVDWSNTFDIAGLSPYVDLFIIMGYDYYWSGSTNAGPTDPLYNFETSYNRTLTRSITFYLAQGMPQSKLLLGLPYYGRQWQTLSNTIPSATVANTSSTKTYSVVRANANGYYSNPLWETNSFSTYYTFQVSSAWYQLFCVSDYSLRARFDVVNQRNIGGIGIWALGYDDGYAEFWNAISDKFSNCAVVPCSDTLWDMGGPNRNYYDNENYTTLIAPTGASQVSLAFSQFDVELNYDTLFIYNGANTSAPLIGAYTGTNSPGTVNSTGPALTIRFKSDGNTVRPGFTAVWNCVMDNTPPTTLVAAPGPWITQDFQASFTDNDNAGGTGIEKAFFQLSDFNGNEWRSNETRGFFNDDFDLQTIHPQWTVVTGTWTANASGKLEQSDENLTNTNIYAPLTETLSNRYLYHWQGAISGTGNNRRAGFHFFCDNPSLTNRGNSYFVWFRVDQGTLEFYEVTNDVFALQYSVPMTVNAGQWYDWKVTYDRITGEIAVYQDNVFVGSWTDPSPYAAGGYISFRSGNSNWQIDDFRVYRSRALNTPQNVTVGNCASCDMRYENTAPSSPAGRVRSLANDNAHNISSPVQADLSIDWTAPLMPALVLDGTAADIDTTFVLTQIDGNWPAATDTNSGVLDYSFAVGTMPGDSDVVAWTNNGNTVSASAAVTLVPGQWYYFSVRATNNAGLLSSSVQSDGQIAELSTAVFHFENNSSVLAYPNPTAGAFQLLLHLPAGSFVQAELLDVGSRTIEKQKLQTDAHGEARAVFDLSAFAQGTYLLVIRTDQDVITLPLIRE